MTSTDAHFKHLPIELLQASTTNPRQHFDRAALDELKASIAGSGIEVPLLVRPLEPEGSRPFAAGDAQYEIVAGERRFRAAQELNLKKLPCLVREMDDAEARRCQITENLQREAVGALEEAEAFGDQLASLGSVAAVAAKLGKEQPYVAKRLRLLKLTLHSSDALRAGLITVDHALLLARLAEAEQNAALKWTLDHNAGSKTGVDKVVAERLALVKRQHEDKGDERRYSHYQWECESVVRLKSHIEEEGLPKLSRAPWKLDQDDLLPDVPACADCPKNTKANVPLFGDLDIGDPTCTDGACFGAKVVAFVQIKLAEAGHDPKGGTNGAVPRLSWKYSGVKPSAVFAGPMDSRVEMANPAKLLRRGQWIEAKKGSCPNVRSGVAADWSDSGDRGYMGGGEKLRRPGERLLVCIASGCKVHRKDWEKPKSGGNGSSGPSQQERQAAHEAREKLEGQIESVEPKIRSLIFQAILRKLDGARALRIVNDATYSAPDIRKQILALKPGIGGEELEALTSFGCTFSRALAVNAYYMSGGGVAADRQDLWKLAKQVGVNADQVAAKAFHDGLTPSLTCLYPKGVPWPGQEKAAKKSAAKTPAKAPSKKNAAVLKARIAKSKKGAKR